MRDASGVPRWITGISSNSITRCSFAERIAIPHSTGVLMLSALNDVPLPRLLVLMNAPVMGLSTFGDTVADAQTR